MTRAVAVVGGGLAGLTAAYRLQKAGERVVVFEAGDNVGGRARTDHLDGFSVDGGAQLLGSMYERTFALVRELGLRSVLVRSPGRDALWRGERAHEVIYGSVASMLASGGLSLRTKMRLGTTYVPLLSRYRELDLHAPERASYRGLDSESIAEWGARELGAEFLDRLVYPQLAAYYGATPEETSAGFYHILARHGMDVTVHALRGGMGRLAEALAEQLRQAGSDVRTGAPVERVELRDASARVTGRGVEEEFSGVVLATPAPVVLRLLMNPAPPLAGWLREVRYRPMLSLALLLERSSGVRYFGLTFPRGEARTVAAVCVQENKGADLVPSGKGLLVALATPESVPRLIESDASQVLESMLPDVARAFGGVAERVRRARVYRWSEGAPIFYPGYLGRLGAFRGGGIEGGAPLALAGDYLVHPSVEGAVTAGETAAERLRQRLRG